MEALESGVSEMGAAAIVALAGTGQEQNPFVPSACA